MNIASLICDKPFNFSCDECYSRKIGKACNGFSKCRISEKTVEQLNYVQSPIDKHTFLKACAGSGKTEVVGLKAAYEIKKWKDKNKGIAILSFTNNATDVIRDRVKQFTGKSNLYPHYIGTLSGFIHRYIVQPFAYKLINYQGNNRDFSIHLVDDSLEIYKNHWLTSYKCNIPYITSQKKLINIYAHQIGFDVINNDFYFRMGDKIIWLRDYYRKDRVQKYISEQRDKRGFSEFWNERFVKKCFCECKTKFWESGYANFDDMNILAIKVLKTIACNEIVNRFPLIIIDECQDLSGNELQVLKCLKDKGCCMHFIGDLNQSIYDFKMVNPENITNFIKDFKCLELTENFRSCKEIVNFSKNLINDPNTQSKNVESKFGKQALLYIEYNTPEEAITEYEKVLKKLKFTEGVHRILVRQNILKEQLEKTTKGIIDKEEPLIVAIQLWKYKTPEHMNKALELSGFQFSKWFGGGKSKQSYYCPKDISSEHAWRMFLLHVLNDMENTPSLSDMEKTYGKWHKDAIKALNIIINNRYNIISRYDGEKNRKIENCVNGINFKTSSGNKDNQISSFSKFAVSSIPIMTIHASKGCTYDSVLVVSSENAKSDGGHWKKHWLQGEGESKRIGYVACTRARYLLVWGVPTLTETDRALIESYGFIPAKRIIGEAMH